jgi:hypothetical protein
MIAASECRSCGQPLEIYAKLATANFGNRFNIRVIINLGLLSASRPNIGHSACRCAILEAATLFRKEGTEKYDLAFSPKNV